MTPSEGKQSPRLNNHPPAVLLSTASTAMPMHSDYSPPLALEGVSIAFLLLGAVCASLLLGDIVWRKGWRRMMAIM